MQKVYNNEKWRIGMRVIDCHCDTLTALFYQKEKNKNLSLRNNNLHLDLERMSKSQYVLQNFAIFLDTKHIKHHFFECLKVIDFYYEQLKENEDIISPAYCFQDIIDNMANEKLSAMLTLEDGEILEGSLSNLRNLYRLGVRMVTLTWNYENAIASPGLFYDKEGTPNPYKRNADGGLTDFGKEVVSEMEKLGIIIDVSHLSDQGFFDVLNHTKKPFIASHSNSASVCSICRNLTDPMLKALGARGGITGLNFCEDFITNNSSLAHNPNELEEKLIAHAHHIVNVAGIETLALGSDFDGIHGNAWLQDVSHMESLYYSLQKSGFSSSDLDKIFYQNVLRIYQDIL